jgi:hypothetical protein
MMPQALETNCFQNTTTFSKGYPASVIIPNEDKDPHAKFTLRISWADILVEFAKRFDAVYDVISSKVHLDMSDMIIDGVTDRWKSITLLDAVVAFSTMKERSRRDCERRSFDQYFSLRNSIYASVLELNFPQQSNTEEIKQQSLNAMSLFSSDPFNLEISDVTAPWDSVQNLRETLIDKYMSKSWAKRQACVNSLCDQVAELHHGYAANASSMLGNGNMTSVLTGFIKRILVSLFQVRKSSIYPAY